eukprot:CAMPEP_0170078562 /NCGR_PEP_ID=MMETSP0019_2-20121128/15122_1 /TAXON_ID=98059 /ORGANISM="Dinobryon sp., Strain UTEXLB2267" /LENGTH=246 /DNA_ID=CAMNT_0010291501 /DNA_START=345 /DNA_END=1085 /DNA_ORIENTATION=+
MNIDRNIDVDRLISARYMDNLEFMQWYKRFFEMTVTDKGNYDAYAQRAKGKGGAAYGGGKKSVQSKPSISSAPSRQPAAASKSQISSAHSNNPNQENAAPNKIVPASASTNHSKGAAASVSHVIPTLPSTDSSSSSGMDQNSSKLQQENHQLRAANATLTQTLADTRGEMEGLEKERDFYFDKLRDIEVMLQDLEDKGQGNELSASIFKVLYATIDGFEPVPTSLEPSSGGAVPAVVSGSEDFEAY